MLSRTPKTPALNNGKESSLERTPVNDIPSTPVAMNLSLRNSDLGVSLKEQNKLLDDMKRENFALKLQLNDLQTRLAKSTPDHIEKVLREHDDLVVKSEAWNAEIRTYKELLFEAQRELDSFRAINKQRGGGDGGKLQEDLIRMKEENEAVQTALVRSQSTMKRLEQQLATAEEEARQQSQRARQLEVDLSTAHRRLMEAQGRLEAQQMEIADLSEQVRMKGEAVMRARSDYSGTTVELNSMTRQISELQMALRKSESEKAELQSKLFNAAANPSNASSLYPQTPDGPRSSLDAIESRLMRELGAASKKLTDMEKKSHVSVAERDQLVDNLRRQSDLLTLCSKTMETVCGRLNDQLTSPVAMEGNEGSNDVVDATNKLDLVANAVIQEMLANRDSLRNVDKELQQAIHAVEALDRDREHQSLTLHSVHTELTGVKQDLMDKNRMVLSLQEQNRQLTLKIKTVTEEEVPLLKVEIEQHKQHINELGSSLDECKKRLVESESRNFEVSRKVDTQNAALASAQQDLQEARRSYQQAVKERDECIAKLARTESDLQSARRSHEDYDSKLAHAVKVRSAVEEQFQVELKQLHSSNTELKVQLATTEKQKQDLLRRIDLLQKSMADLQASVDERERVGFGQNSELNKLRQEAEMLKIERNTLESELIEKQSICKRLESELVKWKRDEAFGRKV